MTWLDWKDLHRSHIGRNKKNRAATDESSFFFSFKSINQRPQAKREKWQVFFFFSSSKKNFFLALFSDCFFLLLLLFFARWLLESLPMCFTIRVRPEFRWEMFLSLWKNHEKEENNKSYLILCVCVCLSRSIRNKREKQLKIEHKRFATFLTDPVAAAHRLRTHKREK